MNRAKGITAADMCTEFASLSQGTPRRQRRGSWFGVTESLHAPAQSLARHAHRNADITVVLEGGLETTTCNEDLGARVHDVLFVPAGLDHSNRFARGGTRTLILELLPGEESTLQRGARLPERASTVPATICGHLSQRVRRAFENDSSDGDLDFEELAHECFGIFLGQRSCGSSRGNGRWLRGVGETLRERFRSPPSLEELGRSAGVHPIHLARAFRAHHGCSVGEFVGRVRVHRAARSLTDSDVPVAHIAEDSGFYDQSHLTRVFKRHVGLTPARYRHLARHPEVDAAALRSYNLRGT
jgi:AraC family transcriptional regulator